MPGRGVGWRQTPAGLYTPQRRGWITRNYLDFHRMATPEQLGMGNEFYHLWHGDAQHIARRLNQTEDMGVGPHHVAAMMAHLSPQTGADENRLQALQLATVYHSHKWADKFPRLADEWDSLPLPTKKSSEGKTVVDKKHPDYERIVQRRGEIRQELGMTSDPVHGSTPLVRQSMGRVRNAVLALHSPDPIGTLGALKIRDFGLSINHPDDYPRAPIDTHIHDAGERDPNIKYDASRGLDTAAHYETRERSLEAARRIAGGGSMPGFMGGVWFSWRDYKIANNPRAAVSAENHVRMMQRYSRHPDADMYWPEAHGRPSLQDFSVR